MKLTLIALVLALNFNERASAQPLPLLITDVQVNPAGHLEYALLNTTPQPATAWSVALTVRRPDGSLSRRMRITTDSFINEARRGTRPDSAIDEQLLMPNTPRQFTLPGPFAGTPELTSTALVLTDGTSLGDAIAIDDIFRLRVAEREARRQILDQIREVQRSRVGLDALQEAKTRLTHPVSSDMAAAVWENARQQVTILLEQATNNRADPTADLARLVARLEREFNATVKHSVRREGVR
jgi:hypothetical protein